MDNKYTELVKDPYNLKKWEIIISSIKDDDIAKIREIYNGFLKNFPLLSNYYLKYIEIEYNLNNFNNCYKIFENGFKYLSYSLEFWIGYIKFNIMVTPITATSVIELIDIFENARNFIGKHYFASDFYKLYLEFLQTYQQLNSQLMGKYKKLLNYILELPIHNYSHFFKKFEMEKFGEKRDIIDLYITTQYKSFKFYEFEKKLRNYYDIELISTQQLKTWEKYIEFKELNYGVDEVIQIYERCLITTYDYPQIWIKYIDFLVSNKKFRLAEQVAQRSRNLNILTDLELDFGKNLLAHSLTPQFEQPGQQQIRIPIKEDIDYHKLIQNI